jgi:hypothetical protein
MPQPPHRTPPRNDSTGSDSDTSLAGDEAAFEIGMIAPASPAGASLHALKLGGLLPIFNQATVEGSTPRAARSRPPTSPARRTSPCAERPRVSEARPVFSVDPQRAIRPSPELRATARARPRRRPRAPRVLLRAGRIPRQAGGRIPRRLGRRGVLSEGARRACAFGPTFRGGDGRWPVARSRSSRRSR